jgi:hypothetical protein
MNQIEPVLSWDSIPPFFRDTCGTSGSSLQACRATQGPIRRRREHKLNAGGLQCGRGSCVAKVQCVFCRNAPNRFLDQPNELLVLGNARNVRLWILQRENFSRNVPSEQILGRLVSGYGLLNCCAHTTIWYLVLLRPHAAKTGPGQRRKFGDCGCSAGYHLLRCNQSSTLSPGTRVI